MVPAYSLWAGTISCQPSVHHRLGEQPVQYPVEEVVFSYDKVSGACYGPELNSYVILAAVAVACDSRLRAAPNRLMSIAGRDSAGISQLARWAQRATNSDAAG